MSSQDNSGGRGKIDRARIDAMSEAELARDASAERDEPRIDIDNLTFYSVIPFDVPNVGLIRSRMGLTQSDFASRFGLSVRTIQQWEQGRTTPDQPARILLKVIEYDPDAVAAAIRLTPRSQAYADAVSFSVPEFVNQQEVIEQAAPLTLRGSKELRLYDPNAESRFAA